MPTRVLSLRTKVALLVAIPLAVMVVFSVVAVIQRFGVVSRAHEHQQNASAVIDTVPFVLSLQTERTRSYRWAAEPSEANRQALDAARAATDERRAELDEARGRLGGANAERFAAAVAGLDGLGELRTTIDGGPSGAGSSFNRYGELIDGVLVAGTDVLQRLELVDVAADVAALDALSRTGEAVSVEQGLLAGVLERGSFIGSEYDNLVAVNARRTELVRIFDSSVDDDRQGALGELVSAGTTQTLLDVRRQALAADSGGSITIEADAWLADTDALIGEIEALRLELGQRTLDDIGGVSSRAEAGRLAYIFVALAALGAFAGALLLMNAWIRKPFGRLISDVNHAARVSLPEAVAAAISPTGEPYALQRISAAGGQELVELAESFNQAQLQVVELAQEQATIRRNVGDIFANLGRRNQKLIARQLSFIDRLEKREQDPEILENLFRLDHLATRMRRNAESLLVLAGTETHRTWSAPVNIGDAVRAAVAEVEQYERAEIRSMNPGKLRGNIASNVSHLLAELIENGLNFSPPDSVVVITGRLRTDGYVLSVVDAGIGIDEDERAVLNRRLSNAGGEELAPSRYLGLFVVARLASRYGIEVELLEGESGGTHARVTLPLDLMVQEEGAKAAADKDRPSSADEPSGRSTAASGPKAERAARKPSATSEPAAAVQPTAAPKPAVQAPKPAVEAEPAPTPATDATPPAVRPEPANTAGGQNNGGQSNGGQSNGGQSNGGQSNGSNANGRNGKAGGKNGRSKQNAAKAANPQPAAAKPTAPAAQPTTAATPPASSPPAGASAPASGNKLKPRPVRESRVGATDAAPASAAQKPAARNHGARSAEDNATAEVLGSGLRRRAPKATLEEAAPAPAATAGGTTPQPVKRSAAEVQSMLSSFRAAQSRAAQRADASDAPASVARSSDAGSSDTGSSDARSSDTNDDEVTA